MRYFAIFLAFFAVDAVACSCAPTDLEWRYENSSNVFIAVVTAARYEDRRIEAEFEVTEVFKGDVPFSVLHTTLTGSSCDTTISVGPEYLFFLGDEGLFSACSGHQRLVPGQPNSWLDLLRRYKAGQTPDLSSPWGFRSHDGYCSLRTTFRAARGAILSNLSLEYRFAVPDYDGWEIEEMARVGYARVVADLPTRDESHDATIQLSTNDKTFTAGWSENAMPFRRRSAFTLNGADVHSFAEALLESDSVRVDGTINGYGRPEIQGELTDTHIRTTNAGDSIERFVQCMQQ
ncbi:MAG: hypothetical protein AAF351_13555 [Pseudomonadota bacterium]